jgi:hypothetical protein
MYAISSDNSRRPSPTGTVRPELPVLFHLMDVSRSRPSTTGSKPAAPAAASPATLNLPATTSEQEIQQAPVAGDALDVTSAAQPSQSPTSTGIDLAPTNSQIAEEPATAETVSEAARTKITTHVSLKPKAPDRRGRKTAASEDWFASHGKFIAIGFVVALIGTVYFARTNRQPASLPKADQASQALLGDNEAATAAAETSSATQVKTIAAVSDSKVELQRPSAPALIANGDAAKLPSSDKLFDFAGRPEEQVASRPTSRSDVSPSPEQPKTEEIKTLPAATTNPSAPVLAPAYPVTGSPGAGYPATRSTPAPANSSATYNNQFVGQTTQPPAANPGWTPPGGVNTTSQNQPLDNTARGPRYERSGSGHY